LTIAARARCDGTSLSRGHRSKEFWRLLTEQEINRSWRSLFRNAKLNEELFSRAEQLLEELRPESPLRHRLETELNEIREKKTKKR
jgi:hypothetical protein